MASNIQSIELRTGVTLDYAESGDPSGLPVLFLHGLSDSLRSYEPILPGLPDSIHAYALSLRGHGDSDRPEDGYSGEELARDVEAFMDALRVDRAVVVGHSGPGSRTALHLAVNYGERLLGLVLVGSFADMGTNANVQQFWESTVSQLEDPVDEEFVREFQSSVKPLPPEFFNRVVEESLKVPARVWKAVLSAGMEDKIADEIHKVRVPTLLVWADQDDFVSRKDQEDLLTAIGNARLLIYEGVGHNVHWEEPDRFVSDFVEFVRREVEGRFDERQKRL